jgi:hypothetical protein
VTATLSGFLIDGQLPPSSLPSRIRFASNERLASDLNTIVRKMKRPSMFLPTDIQEGCQRATRGSQSANNQMVRLVGLEPTTGKTPVDFKPTAYANFATAAPATRQPENSMAPNPLDLGFTLHRFTARQAAASRILRHPIRHSPRRILRASILPTLICSTNIDSLSAAATSL